MWRVIAAISGVTFLLVGIEAIADAECESASLGLQAKALLLTCYPHENGGSMTGDSAGLLFALLGCSILALAFWPLLAPKNSPAKVAALSSNTPQTTESPPVPPLVGRKPTSGARAEAASASTEADVSARPRARRKPHADELQRSIDGLRELGELFAEGILTKDEFHSEKAGILKKLDEA